MSRATENALARQVASANALLARALIHVRIMVIAGIELEVGCDRVGEVPGKVPATRKAIVEFEQEIETIREGEAHLGFAPFPGPTWFDEILAQGPDWAGPVS